MSFTKALHTRITSLETGALVQLRFGKAATKSPDDSIVEARFLRKDQKGDKTIAVFEELDGDGHKTETVISRYPRAPWTGGNHQYVSLIAVDESTITIKKAPTPIQVDNLAVAAKLVDLERDDVFAADELIEVFRYFSTGKRIPNEARARILNLANAHIAQLSDLEPKPAKVLAEV